MEHSERIPARRMGGILAAARQHVGLSLEQVEELATGVVNARVLCAVERGRRRVADEELAVLSKVYGLDVGSLTPARRRFQVDLTRGLIELDGAEHVLSGDVAAPASVVAEYLAMIRRARGADVSSPVALRSGDLAALGEALGQDRGALRTQLRSALESIGRPVAGQVRAGAPEPVTVPSAEAVAIPPAEPTGRAEPTGPAEHAVLVAPEVSADAVEAEATTTCTDLVVIGSTALALPGEVRELAPDAMAELEAVYDEIAALSSRRYHISKRRYRRRHRELLAREQELLASLGFESWSTLIISIASGQAGIPRSESSAEPVMVGVAAPPLDELRQIDVLRPPGAHFRDEPFVMPAPEAMKTSWSEFVSGRVDGTPLAPAPAAPIVTDAPEGFRARFSTESLFAHHAPRSAVDDAGCSESAASPDGTGHCP